MEKASRAEASTATAGHNPAPPTNNDGHTSQNQRSFGESLLGFVVIVGSINGNAKSQIPTERIKNHFAKSPESTPKTIYQY